MIENSSVETASPAGPARKPQSLREIDVGKIVLENLALKTLYLSGSISVLELAEKMRISFDRGCVFRYGRVITHMFQPLQIFPGNRIILI